jgi:tRNA nucleotidyltransferase/poly(A) polymerase
LNFDVYARDFTVNSLLYDFMQNRIYDVTGQGLPDLSRRLVRTHFDPADVVPANPLVITRAIVMNLMGFEIDPSLAEVMAAHAQDLRTACSPVRLAYEYDKISKYEDGAWMLKEFGLEWLKEVREQAASENPKLFGE